MVNTQGKQQQINQNVINNNMIKQLTTQQKTQLPAYQQKWQKIAFATNSLSEENLEKTVKGLYTITGITQPTLIILPHPNAIFQSGVVQENLQDKIDKITTYLARKINHQLREEVSSNIKGVKLNKLIDQLIDLLVQDVEVRVAKLLHINITTSPIMELEDRVNHQLHQQLETNLIKEITKQINFLPIQPKISSNLTISPVILQDLIAKLEENMGDFISQKLGATFKFKILNKFNFYFQTSLTNKTFKVNQNLLNYYQFAALIDFCQTELNCFFPLAEWQAFHFLLNSHILLHPYQNICYVSTIKYDSLQQPVITQHQQKTSLNNSHSATSLNHHQNPIFSQTQSQLETSYNNYQDPPPSIIEEFKLYLLDIVKWLLIFLANIIRTIVIELIKLFNSLGLVQQILTGSLGLIFKSWDGIKLPNRSQLLNNCQQLIILVLSLIGYIFLGVNQTIIYLIKNLGCSFKDNGLYLLSLLNQQLNQKITQILLFEKLPYFEQEPQIIVLKGSETESNSLDECWENWKKINLKTNSIDRQQAEEAIKSVYAARGLKTPKIVFCPNFKFALKEINKFYLWAQKIGGNHKYIQMVLLKISWQNFLGKRLVNNWSGKILLNVSSTEQISLEMPAKINIITELNRVIKNIVRHHFNLRIESFLGQLQGDYWQYIKPEIWGMDGFLLDCYFSVTQDSLNYHKWLAFQQVATNCGWIIPFEKVCFVGDRPTQISLDREHRLHQEGKPALQFGNELKLYYYHGVKLPILYGKKHPNSWEAKWLITERNPALRRVLLQEISHVRIALELQSTTIDTWREYTLLRINERIDDEPMLLLKMTCHSTGFTHALRVPPNFRSAREAATWANWGVDPEEFSIET